jgi:hypothetical protein
MFLRDLKDFCRFLWRFIEIYGDLYGFFMEILGDLYRIYIVHAFKVIISGTEKIILIDCPTTMGIS